MLLAAGVGDAAARDYLDAGVILGVVLINALIGFIQEGKAEQALEAVRAMLASRATVLRDGERHEIDAAELVPGRHRAAGVGRPRAGRPAAAAHVKNLQDRRGGADRRIGARREGHRSRSPRTRPSATARCMAYSGTVVSCGQARGVVVATGAATEIGRIGALVGGRRQTWPRR